jgi:hypothetical protein
MEDFMTRVLFPIFLLGLLAVPSLAPLFSCNAGHPSKVYK